MRLIANVKGLRDVNGKDVAKDAEFESDDRYARVFLKLGKAREASETKAAAPRPQAIAQPSLALSDKQMKPEDAAGTEAGRPRRRYLRRDMTAED